MATIVTRAGKGSALTFQEADDNFTNLNADGTANAASIVTLQNDKLDKSGGVMTGALTVNANLVAGGKVLGSVSNNSQSGSTVTITAPSTEIVRLTNVLLVSVSGIAAGSNGQKLVLVNRSGTTVTIENESSSASLSDQIFTGSGASLSLNDKASISLLYDGTTNRWNIIGGTGSSTGSGGINYILNGDASIGTTGWNAYNDGAVAAPVDGTGGTPAAGLWVRSTTTPLRGSGDFNLVKTGSTSYQGQGVSYDFTIDPADQAKILTISADFEVVSGTYATGDLTAYIIQDPAGTPVVLQPAGYQFESATIGNKVRLAATFQTASNVTSYRLCFHIASTSALDYTLALDTISVSPQQVVYGAPVTDWQDFPSVAAGTLITAVTTNPTYGTVSVNKARWRRVGDSMQIEYQFKQTSVGTAGSGLYFFSLPSGYSIDSTKLTTQSAHDGLAVSGSASIQAGGTTGTGSVYAYDSTRLAILLVGDTLGAGGVTWGSTSFSFANNPYTVSFTAQVPILGWSSSVVVSSSTDTRVVGYRGYLATNTAVTADVTKVPYTTTLDTHGAWSTANANYTIPVPGFWEIKTRALSTASSGYLRVYKNGSFLAYVQNFYSGQQLQGSYLGQFNAGDVLDIRSTGSLTLTGDADINTALSIQRLSGPSQIAASETVAARYINTAGSALTTSGTPANIPFATRVFDTHGFFNGTIATVPLAGKYRISSALVTNAVTLATTNELSMSCFKNGSLVALGFTLGNGASNSYPAQTSTTVDCVAGDTLEIRGRCSAATSLATTANYNWICIERIQ